MKHKRNQIILAVLLFLVFAFLIARQSLTKTNHEAAIYELTIEEGTTYNSVLDKLHEDKLINNMFITKLYVKTQRLEKIMVGTYKLDKSWSPKKILNYIYETIPRNDVLVAFKDGAWAKDIAKEISEVFGYTEKEIIDYWNDEKTLKLLISDYWFLNKSLIKEGKPVYLEGYLYPDTYYMDKTSSLDTITRTILNNFDEKITSIKEDIETDTMPFEDLITLSSIVMYEAGKDEDQRMISGVFRNRLNIDMPLQSSVTVCYMLYEFDDWRECELFKNTEKDSPYNTYYYAGLPLGPILNPNIKAIENTVNFVDHDYLYFVADAYEGGDHKVYYSKTYKEHEKKVNELKAKEE